MLLTGFILGPLAHGYYKFIDKKFPARNISTAIKKILIEQTFAAPPFIGIFFMSCGIIDGMTVKQSFEELKSKFVLMYQVRDHFI